MNAGLFDQHARHSRKWVKATTNWVRVLSGEKHRRLPAKIERRRAYWTGVADKWFAKIR